MSQSQRDRMLTIIQDSINIRCHLEYFVWLQLSVGEFIPHDLLLASWGNFDSGKLHFDVSSKQTASTKLQPESVDVLVPFMRNLHGSWRKNRSSPLLIHRQECSFESLPELHAYRLAEARSCLVHGIQDRRSGEECLYVWVSFGQPHHESVMPFCSLLIPHVDATLRRIELLKSLACGNPASALGEMPLTTREREIMHWVAIGKTNYEIGMILGISTNTAKNHLRHIFKKLNVANRAQAVAKLKAEHQGRK